MKDPISEILLNHSPLFDEVYRLRTEKAKLAETLSEKIRNEYEETIEYLEQKESNHDSIVYSLEDEIESLKEEIKSTLFQPIDGNDKYKMELLGKAYNMFTLQELEEKLGISWI